MTLTLLTSSYAAFDRQWDAAVRTTVGAPKFWPEPIEHVRRITPYGVFGVVRPHEYEGAYRARLDSYGPASVLARLVNYFPRING